MSEPSSSQERTAAVTSPEAESERLTSLLTEQLERRALPEARETVAVLLRLKPGDQDALDIREMLDEQMETVTSGQVGQTRRFRGHKTWVNSVAFAPDGKRALSGCGGSFDDGDFSDGPDRSVLLWDLDSGRKLHRFRGHRSVVNCVAFSPDGRRFLSGGRGGSICLWDGTFMTAIRHFQRQGRAVWSLAFSPDGRLALSGGDDRTVNVWSVRDGRSLRRLEGHGSGVNSVAFSPDGHRVLSGSFDNTVRLWDADSGRQLGCFEAHSQAVLSIAFTPDGLQALSGSMDRTLRLWDLETGRQLQRLTGHTNRVNSVAVAPEGRFALSGGADNTIRLWDLSSGRELRRFQGHTDSVLSVAFAPDGRHALSGSRDRTMRLWQLPSVLDVLNPNEWVFQPDRCPPPRRRLGPGAAQGVNRRASRPLHRVAGPGLAPPRTRLAHDLPDHSAGARSGEQLAAGRLPHIGSARRRRHGPRLQGARAEQ